MPRLYYKCFTCNQLLPRRKFENLKFCTKITCNSCEIHTVFGHPAYQAKYVTYVYCLKDPRDSKVRYIGQTNNLERRFYQHSKIIHKTNNGLVRWLTELKSENLKPIMICLGIYFRLDTDMSLEQAWIYKGLRRRWPLLNREYNEKLFRGHSQFLDYLYGDFVWR